MRSFSFASEIIVAPRRFDFAGVIHFLTKHCIEGEVVGYSSGV